MSRRTRAAGFAAAAAICAGLAAAATGTGEPDASLFGPLRPVLSAAEPLPADRELRAKTAQRTLDVRRIPEAFVPPDALTDPAQAVGRAPAAPIPAGSYILTSQFGSPEATRRGRAGRVPPGRTPVEIAVVGAGVLASRVGGPVDVVVSSEPAGVRAGRTYVAAAGVRLLELRAAATAAGETTPGAGDAWIATLALTREQALRLIDAETYATSIRLLGR